MSFPKLKNGFLFIALLLSVSLFVGCASDEAQIKSTAKSVIKAMKKGELEKMAKYLPKKDAEEFNKQLKEMSKEDKKFMVEMMKEMAEAEVTYGKVTVKGDNATLETISKDKDGKEDKEDVPFVKEGGKWKMVMDN